MTGRSYVRTIARPRMTVAPAISCQQDSRGGRGAPAGLPNLAFFGPHGEVSSSSRQRAAAFEVQAAVKHHLLGGRSWLSPLEQLPRRDRDVEGLVDPAGVDDVHHRQRRRPIGSGAAA